MLLQCTGNVKDRAQVDIVGFHFQIRLQLRHKYLNFTFSFPDSPRFDMLDVPDTNFTISPIHISPVIATQ